MITQSELKYLINYDSSTGIFTRKHSLLGRKAGSQCGTLHGKKGNIYIRMSVKGYTAPAHRLAWLYVYGCMPTHQIDHIDGDRLNNRIENLRDVTQAENTKNRRLQKNNKTGISGVKWTKRDKLWAATIKVSGKLIQLRICKCFFDACCYRKSAELKYGFHPNHGRK